MRATSFIRSSISCSPAAGRFSPRSRSILLIRDKPAVEATAIWWGFALSNVINFPHFAHSYQLLYTGIGTRLSAATSTLKVRLRYLWAGFVAPPLIAATLFGAYYVGDVRILSYMANAMAFTSGWHYVKQGYGVIAVLSAIRGSTTRRSRSGCCCSMGMSSGSTRGWH